MGGARGVHAQDTYEVKALAGESQSGGASCFAGESQLGLPGRRSVRSERTAERSAVIAVTVATRRVAVAVLTVVVRILVLLLVPVGCRRIRGAICRGRVQTRGNRLRHDRRLWLGRGRRGWRGGARGRRSQLGGVSVTRVVCVELRAEAFRRTLLERAQLEAAHLRDGSAKIGNELRVSPPPANFRLCGKFGLGREHPIEQRAHRASRRSRRRERAI
mmetsp:Transcript_57806/g.132767  ORF Transcript_57806/g.132767 Transcript_57806/m.132767 type:complete len:217 (-) Transcript_57806:14-664(-)